MEARSIAELEARIAELEAALTKAHDCATLRDDGSCDGCFVSTAIAATEKEQDMETARHNMALAEVLKVIGE